MTLKSIMIVKDSSLAENLSKKIKINNSIELLALTHKPMEMISRHHSTIDVVFFEVNDDGVSNLEKILQLSKQFKSIVLIFESQNHLMKTHDLSDIEFLFHPIFTWQFDLIIQKITKKIPSINLNKFMTKGDFMIMDIAKKKIIRCFYEEVTVIEIADKSLTIHSANQRPIESNLPLNKIQALLEPVGLFFRVHKSFIISRDYIDSIAGDFIKMNHYGKSIKMGPHYRKDFDKYLATILFK
ncbi:LytR/AlgR family response regulator transcription factor [Pedobacter psychroterrae]|uniref:HTH LytTR-type domain-containing protein n=1 Tax=Pedobacter psychroterrae TaxID=2530453 RepID=A0A4R0NGV0_9SPHI|nr:LytTR family transcriptional regulator DNA-binding domain-containing protein [Pedobacter psychroterrae]TCC99780.1 hypothetical protein EZ437_16190 [Pedobacter psychroterrae]